jgi:chromosome segregation ATPase
MYVPVVEKEILWSKRTKDKSLIGKVKEVIPQISHSKKWPMRVPVERDGKIIQVNSYSLLQDRFYEHMQQAGFEGFERGERGSNREHLSDLDYKIQQDKKRLAEKEKELKAKENELADKEGKLKLAEIELEEVQAEIESSRTTKGKLKTEQERLEADVSHVKELRKLTTKVAEISIPDKPTFSSSVKMPYADVVKLKNMADAYIANEAEIKDVRKRRGAVKTREDNATTRETKVTNREIAVKADETTLKNAEDVKADRDKLQRLFDTQVSEIDVLKTTNNKLGTNLNKAYTIMSDIVEAIQIFKYPVEDMEELDEYRIDNISPN